MRPPSRPQQDRCTFMDVRTRISAKEESDRPCDRGFEDSGSQGRSDYEGTRNAVFTSIRLQCLERPWSYRRSGYKVKRLNGRSVDGITHRRRLWSYRRSVCTPKETGGHNVDQSAPPLPTNSIKPNQQQKRRAAPYETGRPGVVVSQEARKDRPKELLLPLPLLTHAHGHVNGRALEAEGLAQAALDEAAVAGIQEAGGEQHELGRP